MILTRKVSNEKDVTPSILDVLTLVVGEAFNSCTDARSAFEYIQRGYHRGKPMSHEEIRSLKPLLESLNYHAIRENSEGLIKLINKEAS